MAEEVQQAHQIETDFLLNRRDALIAARHDRLARAATHLDEIERRVALLPTEAPLRAADGLRAGLNVYATRFENVAAAQRTLGFTEKEGLQGRLRQAVHAIERRLARVQETRLTTLMLMMRRHEKDFMLPARTPTATSCGREPPSSRQPWRHRPCRRWTRPRSRACSAPTGTASWPISSAPAA